MCTVYTTEDSHKTLRYQTYTNSWSASAGTVLSYTHRTIYTRAHNAHKQTNTKQRISGALCARCPFAHRSPECVCLYSTKFGLCTLYCCSLARIKIDAICVALCSIDSDGNIDTSHFFFASPPYVCLCFFASYIVVATVEQARPNIIEFDFFFIFLRFVVILRLFVLHFHWHLMFRLCTVGVFGEFSCASKFTTLILFLFESFSLLRFSFPSHLLLLLLLLALLWCSAFKREFEPILYATRTYWTVRL